jgi:endonuclease/exonuclease/phosphatase family metal-dependent hydrolase
LIDIINSKDIATMLIGDFNTFRGEELEFLLDNTSLNDAYFSKKANHKIKATEPSWKPKYRLDNILISNDILIENYEILDFHFSDHLPVLVDFSLKK